MDRTLKSAVMATLIAVLLTAAALEAQQASASAAPSPSYIRFVRSLDPSSGRPKPSVFSRVVKAIVGGSTVPTMGQPYGVAVGPDGQLYVADSASGLIHVFGLDKAAYRSIRVDSASLIGIAFSGSHLIVTDSVDGRVLCLDLKGRVLWSLGRRDGFQRPTGVAAQADRIFVVDTVANRVVGVSPSGAVLPAFGRRGAGEGEFNYPTNVAVDRAGRLYVTDAMNFRVQVFDAEGRHLRTFGRLGDGAGDFDKPKGIAVDGSGRIYVVEGLNDIVQVFDGDGQLLMVFGGSGGGAGQLWLPAGITLFGNSVFVTDTANHRVQVYERLGEAR